MKSSSFAIRFQEECSIVGITVGAMHKDLVARNTLKCQRIHVAESYLHVGYYNGTPVTIRDSQSD
jgi:hypothetical protein